MEQVFKYIEQLKSMEKDYSDKYVAANGKYKSLYTANQVTSGLAVVSAGSSIATALTVIGLLASIGTGACSAVLAITSGALTGVGKSYHKPSVKYIVKLAKCREARIAFEKMTIVVNSDGDVMELSTAEINTAFKIYGDVMREIGKIQLQTLGMAESVPNLIM